MAIKTFTSGEVLTASDTNTYLANSGLVYVAEANLTGASVTVPNCFSSTYDSYKIVFSNIKCATGTRFVNLQLRVGGSTSATNYYWTTAEAGAAFTLTSGASPDTVYRAGIVIDSSKAAGGTIEIQNPGLAKETSFQSSGTDPRTTGQFIRFGNGWHNAATAYTDLVLTVATDSWSSGKVVVYGYRQS
jgi:hypothetical protein